MRDRIKESDWKKFRGVHKAALERFCTRVLSEIKYVATDSEMTSHQRYLQIYKLIHEREKTLALLFNDTKRSNALLQLTGLREHGLATDEEFSGFSQELREAVDEIRRLP